VRSSRNWAVDTGSALAAAETKSSCRNSSAFAADRFEFRGNAAELQKIAPPTGIDRSQNAANSRFEASNPLPSPSNCCLCANVSPVGDRVGLLPPTLNFRSS